MHHLTGHDPASRRAVLQRLDERLQLPNDFAAVGLLRLELLRVDAVLRARLPDALDTFRSSRPVLSPPCIRQRPFGIAGPSHRVPRRVLAPHRGAFTRHLREETDHGSLWGPYVALWSSWAEVTGSRRPQMTTRRARPRPDPPTRHGARESTRQPAPCPRARWRPSRSPTGREASSGTGTRRAPAR